MQTKKNIVVYVMGFPPGTAEALKMYHKKFGVKLKTMLLWDSRIRGKTKDNYPDIDIFLSCDFSKPHKIAEALLPYQERLLAVTCRKEEFIGRFAEVLPHVPYLRTPTTESLLWASDKYEMRRRMKLYDPSITPRFTLVKENSKSERSRVAKKIGFPLIVKPTNLAGSLFVSICYHQEEFESTLRTTFRKIKKAYANDGRIEKPRIIAEEYMEGDMYSIDCYVNSRGDVYHCPLVKVVTGKSIGHADFYGYLQITPTGLKRPTVEKAQKVAETAIHALALRNTIVHLEFIKLDDEWKVIELGARMGGFRHMLHSLSCDINHTLNDVLIRIPKKPLIPKKCKGYAAAMKWFAPKQGIIMEMKGTKKILELESFHSIELNKKVGDRAVFARNGGRSIFKLYMYNQERSKLLADIRRVEQLVKISVKETRGSKKRV